MAGRPITKKVINSPETCVDDNLRGVVAVYPALKLHPKHRVVTVRTKVISLQSHDCIEYNVGIEILFLQRNTTIFKF